MKYIIALLLTFWAFAAQATTPTKRLSLDIGRPENTFSLGPISRGSSEYIDCALYVRGTAYPTNDLSGYLFYSVSNVSTQGVYVYTVDADVINGHVYIQMSTTDSLGLSTNSADFPITYYCSVVLTNATQTHTFDVGELVLRWDAATASAGVAIPLPVGATGDNLGNHTATKALDMGGFSVTNVAAASIGFVGGVSFGAANVTAWNTATNASGSGDITAVNITAGTGIETTVLTASGDHDQTIALNAASIASLALADSALQNVAEDTTPTLGGALDAGGNTITNLISISDDLGKLAVSISGGARNLYNTAGQNVLDYSSTLATGAAGTTNAITSTGIVDIGPSLTLADSAIQAGANATVLDGTADRMLVVDGSGDVVEIAYGTSGKVWTSSGASSDPTWETPSAGAGTFGETNTSDTGFSDALVINHTGSQPSDNGDIRIFNLGHNDATTAFDGVHSMIAKHGWSQYYANNLGHKTNLAGWTVMNTGRSIANYEQGNEGHTFWTAPQSIGTDLATLQSWMMFQIRPDNGRSAGNTPITDANIRMFAPLYAEYQYDSDYWNTNTWGDAMVFLRSESADGNVNYSYEMDTGDPYHIYRRSRGAISNWTTVADADSLVGHRWQAYDGNSWENVFQIRPLVDGTVSDEVVPIEVRFQTSDTSGTLENRIVIKADGSVVINNSAGLVVDGTVTADDPTSAQNVVTKAYGDANYSSGGTYTGGTNIDVDGTVINLDAAAQASDDLADSALQPADSVTTLDATAWRTLYSDASGNITELALGTSGQHLKSNGTSSAPTWETPSGGGGGGSTSGKMEVSFSSSHTMTAAAWNIPNWETETYDDYGEFTIASDEVSVASNRWVNCTARVVIDDIDLPNASGTEYVQTEFRVTGATTNRYTGRQDTSYKNDGMLVSMTSAGFQVSIGDTINVRVYVKAADGDQQATSGRWTMTW